MCICNDKSKQKHLQFWICGSHKLFQGQVAQLCYWSWPITRGAGLSGPPLLGAAAGCCWLAVAAGCSCHLFLLAVVVLLQTVGRCRNFLVHGICIRAPIFPRMEFIKENPEIWTPQLKKELYEACRTIIHHEDAFIDLAFEMGPMEGLTAQEVKDYIRFIANRRLNQLGLEPIYDVQKNPLTWLDTMLNAVEHMNFFEGRATEYSKASTKGSWSEAFS